MQSGRPSQIYSTVNYYFIFTTAFEPFSSTSIQGNQPPVAIKTITLPIASISSLLLYSYYKCALKLAYLGVPIITSYYLKSLWFPDFWHLNLFDNPKSITYTVWAFLPIPIKKFSGLISLWIKFFVCINSILDIIY